MRKKKEDEGKMIKVIKSVSCIYKMQLTLFFDENCKKSAFFIDLLICNLAGKGYNKYIAYVVGVRLNKKHPLSGVFRFIIFS